MIYFKALETEYAVGNYFAEKECQLDISEEARFTMIQLIEQIHQMKGYREETLHLAVNIADRYLALLAVLHGPTPSLIELGVIAIMLAAKINEHLSPSYYNIIKIINSQQKKKLLYRSNLLAIERKVLKALNFDLHSTSMLFFMERFQRIFNLEPESARSDDHGCQSTVDDTKSV